MEQLFLDILNRAITAGWLVLVVAALRLLLKRAPKALHYALWLLVGLRLLWPGEELLPRSALSLVPSTETVSGEILSGSAPQISSGIPAINSAVNPVLSQFAATAEPESTVHITRIAAIVWLAGAAALLLYLLVSFLALRLRLRTAVRLEKGVWQSDWVDSPFVLGLLRPRVYLPFGLDEQSRDYVLAHERAHIRHGDHWIKPLAFALLALFWFQPLLWLAYVLLCRDMEYACDERVLRDMEEPGKRAYSQALLNCAAPKRAILACPVAFGETCVKGRIRKALRYKKPAFWVSVAGLAVLTVMALCFFTNPTVKTPYEWASRLTTSRLGEITVTCDNCTTFHSGDMALREALVSSLTALEPEDFVLLSEGAGATDSWLHRSGQPFRLDLGKYTLLFAGDSGYPVALLFQDAVYGVRSEELLQTVLPCTDVLRLTEEEAAAIPMHLNLPGVYWGQWEADGETLCASEAGEDFVWSPRTDRSYDALELCREDGRESVVYCARYQWQGQAYCLLYARGGNIRVLRDAGGGCTLELNGQSLGMMMDSLSGLYLQADCLYRAETSDSGSDLLLQLGGEGFTLWERGSGDGAEGLSIPYQGGQSFDDGDWANWFPREATRPDISGYEQRWLMELDDGRSLLLLDSELYLLSGHIWEQEATGLYRLRPVLGSLSGEDVLALDALLNDVSGAEPLLAISYTGAIQARMRELDSYQALLDYGGEKVLTYCCTVLEYGYDDNDYLHQLAMSTACCDILTRMGEDTSEYAMDAGQEWYQALKDCIFACDAEELAQHPGYQYIRMLGVSAPVKLAVIAREDMDRDGLEESFCLSGEEVSLLRPDQSLLWSWALPDEGDAALWRLQEWTATMLEYRVEADGTRVYRLFTLQNGQEQVQQEARLAPDSDSAAQQAFAEGFNEQLTQEFPPQLLMGRRGEVLYSNTYQSADFLLGADYE